MNQAILSGNQLLKYLRNIKTSCKLLQAQSLFNIANDLASIMVFLINRLVSIIICILSQILLICFFLQYQICFLKMAHPDVVINLICDHSFLKVALGFFFTYSKINTYVNVSYINLGSFFKLILKAEQLRFDSQLPVAQPPSVTQWFPCSVLLKTTFCSFIVCIVNDNLGGTIIFGQLSSRVKSCAIID